MRAGGLWKGGNGKMGREEQIEEREVLESIFPDEITGDFSSLRSVLYSMIGK